MICNSEWREITGIFIGYTIAGCFCGAASIGSEIRSAVAQCSAGCEVGDGIAQYIAVSPGAEDSTSAICAVCEIGDAHDFISDGSSDIISFNVAIPDLDGWCFGN